MIGLAAVLWLQVVPVPNAIPQPTLPAPPPVVEDPTSPRPAAQPSGPKAPTYLVGLLWKQAIWQGIKGEDGAWTVRRGDVWGGRLAGGLGIGRLGIGGRLDISGLKDQFDLNDPTTYTTVEAYGTATYYLAEAYGMTLAVEGALGAVTGIEGGDGKTTGPLPNGPSFYGVGLRIGDSTRGSSARVGVAHHGALAEPGRARLYLSGQAPINDRLWVVGDAISGRDGYVRVGVAVRFQ